MASTATASSSSQPPPEEVRPQAGPLPQKRGEIGYQESMQAAQEQSQRTEEQSALPERHPADAPPEETASQPRPPSPSASETHSDASSMHKPPKHNCWPSWLRSLSERRVWGVRFFTFLRLPLQVIILAGTIVAWVFIAKQIAKESSKQSSANASGAPPSIGESASIFVHVTFGITVLAQLIFLERGIYFVRAQRYAFLHPDSEVARNRAMGGSMPFAPWNRPALPSYAATLAQSGVGTGDVEDNVIAIPPPPAYGNIRGSRLLLQGFMRNSLRAVVNAQRSSDSLSLAEMGEQRSGQRRASNIPPDRPLSYMSTDPAWEERCDAERALRLAETLERLEQTSTNTVDTPSASR